MHVDMNITKTFLFEDIVWNAKSAPEMAHLTAKAAKMKYAHKHAHASNT